MQSKQSESLFYRKIEKKQANTAIIFIHGLGGSHNYWGDEYNQLADNATLYFVDLLGFGYSPKPDTEYTLDNHCKAMAGFIKPHVIERRIILVGHSTGAIIALAYTAMYPQAISRAILLSLPLYNSKEEAELAIRNSRSLSFFYRDTLPARLACYFICNFRPVTKFIVPYMFKHTPKRIAQDALLHTYHSYMSTLRNVSKFAGTEQLFSVEIKDKIVLIHGTDDKTAPYSAIKNSAERLGLILKTIPNEGHDLPLSVTKSVLRLIKDEL